MEKQFERDKLKHTSHMHYLIFNENEVGHDDVVIICDICETSLQGPAYGCGTCEFSIHKSCAELPLKIDHPFHCHPLTLSKTNHHRCDACLDECSGMAYRCHECCYNLHYHCTALKPSINFKELKCVLHEVMQSLLEKQPQDVELRTIQERNPEDLTFHDVFSSFTEKDRNQLDDITENIESEIAGIKKTLSETGDQGSKVTISESYPYSDDTLAQFILRLQNSLRSKNMSVEFWDLDDVLVNVM
ncbi:hypothetical protein CISIN_1g043301mg, partial [Citrus sinensis]